MTLRFVKNCIAPEMEGYPGVLLGNRPGWLPGRRKACDAAIFLSPFFPSASAHAIDHPSSTDSGGESIVIAVAVTCVVEAFQDRFLRVLLRA